ncbi:MAG: leucine-rich repeat protein, partial [Lachnospiraceae bacterium]|nr:leucine-rich repeat protein [Lachnospiraceae bacterium]
MKGKRVLTLLLAAAVTFSNGSIVFAAESSSTEYTETTGMEAAVREEVQQSEEPTQDEKTETGTDTEKPEEVLESTEENPEDNENKEAVTENLTETEEQLQAAVVPEEIEDVPAQGAATSGNYGVNMGDNITWNFDGSTGTLTLSGSGEMYNLSPGEGAEWHAYYDKVKRIVINKGISSIGTNAFYGLDQAESIDIPDSVKTIYPGALQGCDGIRELHLPNSLTGIGDDALLFMNECTEFHIDKPETSFYTKDGVLFNNTTLLYYPQNKMGDSYSIPYGTQIVEDDAFTNPRNLTSVYIPETVVKTCSSSFENWHNFMTEPVAFTFNTTASCFMQQGTFRNMPTGSKVRVKTQTLYEQLLNETLTHCGAEGTTAEIYSQGSSHDNYNAMKDWYADASKKVESNQITLFGMHQDAATDCVTWSSSDPSVAAVVVPVVKFEDLKNRIYYNEAETSCSGGYVKGGTKPGTATITVTREDKKEFFSFTVENVVPTTSTEIYHKADGKQQVLGNSLCIHTGKSDTVRLQTVPELTTALAGTVTWTSSDDSKVVVEPSGAYNEKATLYRKAAGDVTVTATMKDENENAIQKSFQVIGNKSTEDWYVLVNDGDRVWVTDSTPVKPIVVVRDSKGTVFKEGTDYTVQYQDNYLPDGKAAQGVYVYVTPIGSYVGNPVLTGLLSLCRGEQPDDTDNSKNPDTNQKKDDNQNTSDSKKPQNSSTMNKLKKQKITKVSSTYKKSVGQSFTLKPKAKGKITYKTGNKKVATVNSKGKVTVKGTGKATITVTAKATSTYSKCVKKITVYGVPKKPEMKKLTAGKKKFTIQWKKDKKADGYQVQYSTDKKFKKNVKSVNVSKKSTKATVKKLKKRKTYRVRVRSY